jgi:hypothetical protein
MRIPARHWLDYDSVALAVLMLAISILELLVLGF